MRKFKTYGSIIRGRYDNWEDLIDHLENAPENKITMSLNKHLLERHTLDQLVEIASRENERLGSNDFRTVAIVRKHIKWLEDRGWIFNIDKNGAYKLVNYKRPN
jgi:hypothetical protein